MRQRTSLRSFISLFVILFALVVTFASTGCNQSSNDSGSLSDTTNSDPVFVGKPTTPTQSEPPGAEDPVERHYTTDALVYNGTGVSASDATTVALILNQNGHSYKLVNSAQLNAMSLSEMTTFGMIVVPGGHGDQITNGLKDSTRMRVRDAVRTKGVSYVGFCAGAWVAIDDAPAPGKAASYGFGVVTGNHLKVYHPDGRNPTAAMVDVSFVDGSKRDLVWWGGPYLLEWENGVIARYSTGEPAMAQTWAGNGFVVLSGPHPEAPQGWRSSQGLHDTDGLDYDIALGLMEAALKQNPLPVF